MAKSLLEAFKTLDPQVKESLADIQSPLLLCFAAIDLAYQTCGVQSLTAEHITACLEAAGVYIKKQSVLRALARAGSRVCPKATIDGETSYSLMTKGKREIPDLLGKNNIAVIRIDSEKPRTARLKLNTSLLTLKGTVKICDPYYGIRTFDSLDQIPKSCTVKFLSSKCSDPQNKVFGILKDFKRENPKFEMRTSSGPTDVHDRYLVTNDNLLLLGHGLKDIGNKESFMIKLGRETCADLIDEVNASFEKRWNLASPI